MVPGPDNHDCGWKQRALELEEKLAIVVGQLEALNRQVFGSVLDSRGAGARKRGRLEPRGRPSLDGKATREDERRHSGGHVDQ
jgi:hypothetical protein